MLDRVTGGGPRISCSADDPPKRSRDNRPGSGNPWTMQAPRAAVGAVGASRALPAHRARQTPSSRRRPRHRSQLPQLAPITARQLQIIGVLILIIGLGVTGVVLLTRGHPPVAPQRSPVASTSAIDVSDTRSLVAEKRAMSLSLERLASERQAAERRRARARGARRHARMRTHDARSPAHTVYAVAASSSATAPATSSTSSVSSPISSPETSSVQSSTPAALAPSTTTAPSSGSSSSDSTNQSASAGKQPAFGSKGTLGPGSSPDG